MIALDWFEESLDAGLLAQAANQRLFEYQEGDGPTDKTLVAILAEAKISAQRKAQEWWENFCRTVEA